MIGHSAGKGHSGSCKVEILTPQTMADIARERHVNLVLMRTWLPNLFSGTTPCCR